MVLGGYGDYGAIELELYDTMQLKILWNLFACYRWLRNLFVCYRWLWNLFVCYGWLWG